MSESRLTMRGVSKRFGATVALRNVNLAVQRGPVMGLVGENGAGKSTLMKVLSGAHAPDEGMMTLDGEPYRPRHPLDARRQGVAMIYQELSLAPHLSVAENVLLGIEPTLGPFVRRKQAQKITRHALNQVGLEHVSPTAIVGHLSLAQQQLVEIARAVATECRVLVLDEPTSSLTRQDIDRLFALIRRLKAKGMAIIYISHFLEEVRAVCDRFSVLRDGESVGEGEVSQVGNNEIIAMMVGRQVDDLYPRNVHQAGEVVLSLHELAGKRKPASASLQLRRGEVLGIAGLIGAGRTEMMRAIFGMDPLRSGQVKIGLFNASTTSRGNWRRGAGMVSEDRKNEGLAVGLSIAQNVTLPKLRGLGPWRFVRPGRQNTAVKPWIEKLAIRCQSASASVSSLSGGNQQKVAIARLLHADVDVLLLDEPTRGIDVGSKAQIYRLIDELARGGKAVLMVSSYLPELLGVCDRIAVMCRGRLGEARPVDQWNEHDLMVAAIGKDEQAA
ncbi:MAG: sugar ABC transporter ATP-binding protein [Phycisphaeraceae bacterium]|nr:sugar ABC transporter ATP-binding protein [Phycisphaeraceae bacterium]